MKKAAILTFALLLGGIILLTNCQQTEVTSAKVYMSQSNYDKAIELCNEAIQKMPENPDAYFIMGQAYGHKKMYVEMNDAFTKSLQFSEANAADIEQHRLKYWIDVFNNGVALIRQDNVSGAIERFNIAKKLLPDRIDAYKNLAYAYTQNEQDSLAILTYQEAIEQDPNDLELKGFLGSLLYVNKKYESAVEILSEVLEKADPQSKEYNDALYNLAYSYDLMGQSDKAIEAYQTALRTAPDDKDLMFNMGRLYFMQNNFEKAIETFSAVISKDPDDFDANLNVGNAYLSIADSLAEEARKVDDQGNSIHPQSKIEELVSQSKGFFEKAIPYLEKATEIKPDNANAWTYLGVAYVRVGKAEEGTKAFEKADQLKNQ